MNYWQLLTVCVSLIIGCCGVASVFVNGWVKYTHITELKGDIDKLWARINKVEVVETKIEAIENVLDEIKQILYKRLG